MTFGSTFLWAKMDNPCSFGNFVAFSGALQTLSELKLSRSRGRPLKNSMISFCIFSDFRVGISYFSHMFFVFLGLTGLSALHQDRGITSKIPENRKNPKNHEPRKGGF